MKKVILAMTAVAAASIAAPVSAQYFPAGNQSHAPQARNYAKQNANDNMAWRIEQLQARFQEGLRNGSIDRREARPIRESIQRLTYLARQYGVNGLTGRERATLQQRIRTVRQQLRRSDDGAQGRYAHWDREDRYGWAGYGNDRVDANNDGWDDRDYNRNHRWDDDANYGYQQPASPTGIAGIIHSIVGGGSLQVGQRAPSNLYGVPLQYQAQFRDGNGVYYRSDGRNIYQVDARSQTVVRIFAI